MKYYEYIFQCEKLPTKHTLHSLVTNFFGKGNLDNINYKVFQEGRLIKIITDVLVYGDFVFYFYNKKGEKFSCKFYKLNEKETNIYKKGEKVILSGLVEYGVNVTGKKGKRCPVFLGRFESNELKNLFKQNIEKNFGVKIESMKNIYFTRQPSEILEKHIQFNNIILINLPVIVDDVSIFSKIEFKSYFQKKSYGFGCMGIT